MTRTRDLSYVGTSRMLSREIDSQGETKSYDYDSAGRRLGQGRTPTPVPGAQPAPEAFRAYAVDANGSVEGLEDGNGVIAASDRYVYDPYGENDKVPATNEKNDGDQGLSADAKENPFRFEGFYFDSGIKTYDMQARVYRPDSGRFLSQDRYEAAAGDQALQTDPLTQNRYAFAGGNPVTNVEFDGHMPTLEPGSCNAACRRQRHHDNANANRSGRNRDAGGRPPAPQSRARAQERYYSTFQMRPRPPVDHLHAKHSPEEAERVLEEWEKEHGQHMSAGRRLMHLQALQDGHWYKILAVEQPNPYAGPVALGRAAST